MRTPVYTRQFERDIKKAEKRGKSLEKLKIIVRALIEGRRLDPLHRDHQLVGSYAGRRECHIEAEWLLIYKIEKEWIIFERTGSHSDLFKK
jgi:mRNA interferase YafQ